MKDELEGNILSSSSTGSATLDDLGAAQTHNRKGKPSERQKANMI